MVNILTSRKAEEQTLFQMMTVILVLGVVLFTFLSYINQATSSTYPQKNFLATDLALIMDAIQLLEGNLELTYSSISTKNKFTYEFENSQVKVSDSKLDLKKGNGYFLMNKNMKLKNKETTDELKIGKEGNVIFVNENRGVNPNTLECPKEKVPFVRSLTAKGGELANTINKIAASDFEEGNDLVLNADVTPNKFGELPREDSEVKEKQRNYLKIFYPKNKERIACEIANKISEELLKEGEPFEGMSIIPSNELTLEFSKNYNIKMQTVIASAIIEGIKNAER